MSDASAPVESRWPASAFESDRTQPPVALSPRSTIWMNLLVALAYAALGIGAVALILPPHFVSPIYPAAGLAVAAALRWGPRALPGIVLGGVLVSLAMAQTRGHFSVVTPLLVGVGGAAQAAAGAWLSRRWVGPQPLLTEPRELLRFFAAVALLACVVGATVGVTALWLSRAITLAQVPASWLSWWVGDAMGVVIAAPIALSLFGLPRAHWAPRRLGVAMPMLVACVLLGAATYQVAQDEEARRRHAFELQAINTLDALTDTLHRPLTALEANHSLLMVAPQVTQAEFERANAERMPTGGAVFALGWASWVPWAERAAVARAARAEGLSGYEVHERHRPGDLPPEIGGDALAIRLIVPLQRNRGAMGVNIRSIPEGRAAQERAIATGRPQASESFALSQDVGLRTSGVVVYRAVYEGPPTQRRLRGMAFATLRPEILLREGMGQRTRQLDYCLIDMTPGTKHPLLAGDESCLTPNPLLPRQTRPLQFAGRSWELAVYSPEGLPALEGHTTIAFAMVGLVSTALLGVLLMLVTGRTARVAQLVEEGTRRLRESEERFRSIVEHAPVGVVFTDIYARPKEINPYFCKLLDMSAERLKARSIMSITHPDDRAEDSRLGIALIRGDFDRYSRIKRYVSDSGKVITVRATVSLLRDAQGAPYRLLGVVEDIGEQLRLHELERVHEAELAANRAKNEFLSRMSHELRTPLNAMLGFAQLLVADHENELHPRQRGWLTQIQQSGWHLLQMIDDTLDLSRLDAGQLRVVIEPLALAPVVADSLAMVDGQRERRQVRIDLALQPEDVRVMADSTRLKQVLTNLLSNAVKYNHDGGHVSLTARQEGETVHISVQDTGAGLTLAQQAQLFQPFNRLGREVGGIEGTGIGLVITQRLLELMGSRLSVVSEPGQGATFSFSLPAAPPVDPSASRLP